MRFTTAWSATSAQNTVLRSIIMVLGLLVLTMGISLVKLSEKDPLVIERACFNQALKLSSNERTSDEIKIFVKEALAQRFNSDAILNSDLLSQEERNFREQEQKDLASRQITQKVIVNQVKIDGSTATVDADRLVSVSQIRSAFVLPLKVIFGATRRSESNPYGLQIVKVSQEKTEGK